MKRALLRLSIPLSIAALLVQAPGLATPVLAANTVDVAFSYTGSEQYFDVPQGVDTVHFVNVGGAGGAHALATGGHGARVEGDMTVAGGYRLYVEVGGNGADSSSSGPAAGGFNGGGEGGYSRQLLTWGAGGGGASDLRGLSATDPQTLTSRLVIAAGGGGAGLSIGAGGDADSPGGGGTAGGGPGSGSAGGAGGSGTPDGSPGELGIGGAGNDGSITGAGGGGGGGGGLYGGGGGAYDGGGGGGSSDVGLGLNTSITLDSSGVPSITLTYVLPAGGTVQASVTMAVSAACLELSTTLIDFGTRQFGETGVPATPGVTVSNCGGVDESVYGRGSDAIGGGPTTWTLNDSGSCADATLPTDNYGLTLEDQQTQAPVRLSTTNKAVGTLPAGSSSDQVALMDTPCPGSSGAGVMLTMQIVFVAAE